MMLRLLQTSILVACSILLPSARGNNIFLKKADKAKKKDGPTFAELPPEVKDKFTKDKKLKKNFKDLPLQATNKKIKTKCKAKNISLDGFEESARLVTPTTCKLDDKEVPCPLSNVYTKYDKGRKITVSKTKNGDIKSIHVVDPECAGSETFESVVPGLVTSIPSEAYDEDELSKFVYGNTEALTNRLRTRNLRSSAESASTVTKDVTPTGQKNRKLQNCPEKSIKLAVAFDSSYCSDLGDYTSAYNQIVTTVANVAALYEGSTCLTVEADYIEGFCDPATDPYKPGVDTNKSGCTDEGLLDVFQDFWNANRQSVDRDLAHLASGTGLECSNGGCVIGCAYVNVMCTSPSSSYGVNYMTFTGNQALLDSLLAHEMGHNVGEYYMVAPLERNCSAFF